MTVIQNQDLRIPHQGPGDGDALLRLIEQRRPYTEISIQEIVDKAGVCRPKISTPTPAGPVRVSA